MDDNDLSQIDASLDEFVKREIGSDEYWEKETGISGFSLYALISPVLEGTILPSIKANALINNSTKEELRDQCIRALRLIIALFKALHHNVFSLCENEEPHDLWHHQKYDFLRANDLTRGIAIDKAQLTNVAADYLSHPEIRNNKFDWMLLDAFVFAELDAYTYHVVNTGSGTGINWAAMFAGKSHPKYYGLQFLFVSLGISLRYLAMPAIAYFLMIKDYGTLATILAGGWLLYLAFLLFGFPKRWRARKKRAALLSYLADLYGMLGDGTISPRRFKETLDKVAAEGVVLDGAVFSLVDRMVARDATAFIPSQVG